jgi:predicted nucleic acid-binding protein
MSVLIDSSVWIEYFRNGNNHEMVDFLIDENLVVTNDLILAELTPFLKIRKQKALIDLLLKIYKLNLMGDPISMLLRLRSPIIAGQLYPSAGRGKKYAAPWSFA